MSSPQIVVTTFLLSLLVITGCWAWGVRHGNDLSPIDGYYGVASLLHGGVTYALWEPRTTRGAILAILAGMWALGLGQSLLRRWLRHRSEGGEARYRLCAEMVGAGDGLVDDRGFWWKTYLTLAAPQAVLISILNLPLQYGIMIREESLEPINLLGFALIAAGGAMEIASNLQLEIFKRRGAGRTLMTGLWSWCRHPNYFGHALVFFGFFIVTLSHPRLWWTGLSPIAIVLVLRYVTGVPFTDRLMREKRRGDPSYLEYVAATPSFVPLPAPLRRVWADTPGRASQRGAERTALVEQMLQRIGRRSRQSAESP
jgi:steroid 5-alpha reductase family enzyme